MTPGIHAVGLVIRQPTRLLGLEAFSMQLIAGIEEALSAEGRSLLLHIVGTLDAELATYRRWAEQEQVEAVVVHNLAVDDPRLDLLAELAVPAVVVGGPSRDLPVAHVFVDNAAEAHEAVDHLVALGHARLARVSGPVDLAHTRTRTDAFLARCAHHGVTGTVVEGDYGEASGARATREVLAADPRPTAVVFDNDVMAVAALDVAREAGLRVPTDLSLLAWDDSPLARHASPPLSAMSFDVHALGVQVGDCVLNVVASGPVRSYAVPPAHLVTRGSTAPAPRA
ncbi:LacI family DNA-binding transcriptional regulator [Cellulomonas fimi]|uniref:Periplasmic binding protein/LacI transcriptional regulator n=1 Tax=Cellulomonas fimi (strain ATCC 484 / DSM 20113 / JCM 1341 / CCUG 24087 / LMG 16345 / NBRC 15513 / NCIMB 8980 / NCTC 7547 / NRS-133) TaxID=590998 RepID=F4H3D2_CELFA|nr:substrate-binding domain-containing protein [Cellulomonas fimi]AEE45353.1 periplasmic binding protein/LacI transcriptional regulator [Cellulomonas fimi ATCC 484]NNH08167.1 LacI family transcriptional regulator [Cellulomonas fimi]VEH29075.1 Purine nucleotide synthesis repressor [Cellulomonas fimi]